jgi:hypothetical protein
VSAGGRLRRGIAAVLAGAVAAVWLIPSDVARLVARQQHVLLGRYDEGHFVAAVLCTLLFLPAAWMLARGVGLLEVLARVGLATGAGLLAFAVASIASYAPAKQRYLETPVAQLVTEAPVPLLGSTRRRQPERQFKMDRADLPPAARSYPGAPPGFPEARIVLTTDRDGLRNGALGDAWEVVVAGDSFAEGSMVSDDEVWSARLAAALDRPVRNVAMSGASPRVALNNLVAFGARGSPRLVIVSVYEGNDFKDHGESLSMLTGDAARPPTLGNRLAAWRRLAFKDSPLRARLKQWLIGTLGPVRSDAPVSAAPGLSWMPVRIESGAGVRHYAFDPGELLALRFERERFERSRAWTTNADVFRQAAAWARATGVELVFLYVPSKPHVVMPLVRDAVSAEALRAFAAYKGRDLPPADRFAEQLYGSLDALERVFFDFCAAEALRCASTTEPLRRATAAGEQVYFTYDPHWTRLGHALVADLVAAELRKSGLAPR